MAKPAPERVPRKLREIVIDDLFLAVLFDGMPLAGTTRQMYQVVRDSQPDDVYLLNTPCPELVQMVREGQLATLPSDAPTVVWLDDLAPADLVMLDPGTVTAIARRGMLLANVKTAWVTLLAADTSPVTAPARQLLASDALQRLTVPFEIPAEQRADAQATFPHVSLGVSLGESLVGGDELVRHYDSCRDHEPDLYLLVSILIDLRRAGVHRGATSDTLRTLYNRLRGHRGRLSRRAFTALLDRACQPPEKASIGMIGHDERLNTYRACAYLAGADDGDHGHPHRPITEDTWSGLIAVLPRHDAYYLGFGAHLRGHVDIAATAWERAVNSSHVVIAEHAVKALNHRKS